QQIAVETLGIDDLAWQALGLGIAGSLDLLYGRKACGNGHQVGAQGCVIRSERGPKEPEPGGPCVKALLLTPEGLVEAENLPPRDLWCALSVHDESPVLFEQLLREAAHATG
ncbi:MAG TPA: hypothetical protein VLC09_07390, partial [Polyangiaceae bacterium]|nr:hypothetical protein [Polyangiaceae bacterium]